MKKCPSCGVEDKIITESIAPKRKKVKCQECGWQEVRDERDKPLLTDDMPLGGKPIFG